MGVGVFVGTAVGGRGVLVGSAVGCRPGGVAVGLDQAGGSVWVGNMTAAGVSVGLNKAVMVRSGVGNANGVGEATKGKLQASIDSARAKRGMQSFFLKPASDRGYQMRIPRL